jgi:hypothetical protein
MLRIRLVYLNTSRVHLLALPFAVSSLQPTYWIAQKTHAVSQRFSLAPPTGKKKHLETTPQKQPQETYPSSV